MKEVRLENITLDLLEKSGDLRIGSPVRTVLLRDQSAGKIIPVLERNYMQVVSFYRKRLGSVLRDLVDPADVSNLSVIIVLDRLYVYNSWRIQYPNVKKYKDLSFREDDLNHPSTHDLLFHYFRANYPMNWEEICRILLDMSLEDLKSYYKRREQYYNK